MKKLTTGGQYTEALWLIHLINTHIYLIYLSLLSIKGGGFVYIVLNAIFGFEYFAQCIVGA